MKLSRPSLGLLLLATTLVAFAPAVRAEDASPSPPAPAPAAAPAPSAVSRLTAEELEFVRRRLPDFDRRDEAEREKIATNVLRLRSLSPEERKRFVERVRRVEAEGGPGAAAAADRLGQLEKVGRASFHEGMQRMRAVSTLVVASLSPERRAVLTPDATPSSLGGRERLQFDVCVAAAWKRRVVERLVAAPPVDAEPLAGASPGSSAKFVAARDRVKAAGGAAAPEGDRRGLALAYFDDRVGSARRAVDAVAVPPPGPVTSPGTGRDLDARLEAFGRALRDAFPSSIEAVAAEVGAAVDGGRATLRKFCDDAMPDRATPAERVLVELVVGLERARPFVAGDLLGKLCALQIAALRELRVADADLQRFQPGGDEPSRLLVLAPFVRRLARAERAERGAHAGLGFRAGGERERFGGGRRGPGMGDGAMGDGAMGDPAMSDAGEPGGSGAPDAPPAK